MYNDNNQLWDYSNFSDVLLSKPQYGLTARSSTKEGNTIYLRISDITEDGKFKTNDLHYVQLNSTDLSKYELRDGDFLIARSGTVGRVYLHSTTSKPTVFASYLIRFKLDTSKVLPRFVLYWGLSDDFQKQVEIRKKTVAQPNINAKDYTQFRMPVPPISQQQKIIRVLDQISTIKSKREQANKLTSNIIQSVFLKMFGDPDTNPMGWKFGEFRDLIEDIRYGTSVKCSVIREGSIPVLRIPNVVKGSIELDELKFAKLGSEDLDRYILREGDLLFVRTNGNRDYVGRCAAFHVADRSYAFASYLIRARLSQNKLNPDFTSTLLSLPTQRSQLFQRSRTSAGQYNINTEAIKSIKIILPPLNLQENFVEILKNYLRLTKKEQGATKYISELFQSLMHKVFGRELRI